MVGTVYPTVGALSIKRRISQQKIHRGETLCFAVVLQPFLLEKKNINSDESVAVLFIFP